MMHPLATSIFRELSVRRHADQAPAMQAYMKTEQPFYGIQTEERRQIFRECARTHPVTSPEEYEAVIRTLWDGSHREDLYQALEVAEHFKEFITPRAWPLYEFLIRSSPNWDTLDWAASKLAGKVLLEDRQFESQVRAWRQDENFWVRRASLLVHLNHREDTNIDLLGETIRLLLNDPEFFIRKAIGWVLREYAKTNPRWVIDFVREYEERMAGLSRREALKHVEPDPDEL